MLFLGDVVHSAFRSADGRSRARPNPPSLDIVEEVKLVLAARMRERLTLHALASVVNCSPYTLCRLFKQVTDMSVHRYLLRLRLLGAMDELAEGPKTRLVDVALEFGFSSHSRFSASFRREFGTPPSEFRRVVSRPNITGKNRIARP